MRLIKGICSRCGIKSLGERRLLSLVNEMDLLGLLRVLAFTSPRNRRLAR